MPTAQDFTIYARRKGSKDEPWPERYQKETDNPEKWGRELIDWFNSTRRDPQQHEREFVRVEIHGEVPPPEHRWTKTSLTTQLYQGRAYDAMKCERCGITGKRWRLGENPRPDSQYRARLYKRCDLTLKHKEKLKSDANASSE